MRVWVEIWDATYVTKLGRMEPIMASYKRKLDEAGMGRATFLLEPKNLGLIRLRRVVEVWLSDVKLEWTGGSQFKEVVYQRKLGAFVIEAINPDPKSRTITLRGSGVMSQMINYLALPGLSFDNRSVKYVLEQLALLAGWTVSAESALNSTNISVRFAGENVLRAMRFVAESQGYHIRESDSVSKQVEAGAFGTVNSLAEHIQGDGAAASFYKESPMMIEDADITEESAEVVNKIYAFGGGDGDAALTMELSNRSFVDSETANGRTHYFIADAASISLYGQIGRRVDIKRINPTDASDAALSYASTALADAAKAWLDRHSQPYEMLKLRVRNVNETIQPGDKVWVRYLDVINLYGVPYQERDIDEAYWVMAVEESVNADGGLEVSLEVANVDRYEANDTEIVVGMVDSINVQNVNIQPYPAPYYYPTPIAPIDTVTSYEAYFAVNEQTVRLNRAVAAIFRSPWQAVAGVAAAGGDHRHRMMVTTGTFINPIDGYAGRVMQAARADLSSHAVIMVNASNDDMYTEGASGTHSHDTEFSEVQTDDAANLLEEVELTIDGVTVESGLFPDGDSSDYVEVDITAALKAGTLRGYHTVGVSCAVGRGDVYCIIFIDVDVSRVRS